MGRFSWRPFGGGRRTAPSGAAEVLNKQWFRPPFGVWPRRGPGTHARVRQELVFCVRRGQGMGLAGASAEHTGRETQVTCTTGIILRLAAACAFSEWTELPFCRFSPISSSFLLKYERPVAIPCTTLHCSLSAIFFAFLGALSTK